MVKLIVGVKGTGKTKMLIDMVNNTVETSSGSVVCIEKGNKLRFDVRHEARLINTSDYDVNNNTEALYGFVCGLYAANYDITHIFIDSALKICGGSAETFDKHMEKFTKLIQSIAALAKRNNLEFIITSSIEPSQIPEELKKFV